MTRILSFYIPLSVKILDQKFCIAVLYRPPDSPISISDTLFHSIELIDISQYSNFILVWDFNVDVSNQLHPLHPKVTSLLDLFCLSQVVTGHTRESCSGRCSLLDLVLTMNPNILYNCSVIPPLATSDHLGVFSIFNLYAPKPSKSSYILFPEN